MLEYLIRYYQTYGPLLLLVTIVFTAFYWVLVNWGMIRATYRCVNLKNTVTGNIGKCFSSNEGTSCQNTDLGYIYGWCNDADNYGPLPGKSTGPYVGYCSQWSWCKGQCPPYQCSGSFPKGIGEQEPQVWGWCADAGVERAMIGTACGPRGAKCNNWLWDVKKCPTSCQKPPPMPLRKRCGAGMKASVGEDGTLNCKPVDKCQCDGGPPLNPWSPLENKVVRVHTKDEHLNDKENSTYTGTLKGERCYLTAGRKGDAGISGVTENEKVAKFDCAAEAKGDAFVLEKSNDGKFRLVDANGCALRWARSPGGNPGLENDERMAKFDCGNNGDPLDFEGTPDDTQFYALIDGKKCGLQWSAVEGKGTGVGERERIAKFDCAERGDTLEVSLTGWKTSLETKARETIAQAKL